jgi:aminoglycoside phosphotransferase (APT) family kinase protein
VSEPVRWTVEAKMSGGMQAGAWRARNVAGTSAVLKWIAVEADDAATVVEHARSCGYPTPRWLDHGTTEDGRSWCVQEHVDGTPMGDLDVAGAHLIVELVALQRTITPPTERGWPDLLRLDELVHSDLAVQNILLRDGKVAGVIDFEEAARGCAALDLMAPAVNAVIWRSDPKAIDVLHCFASDSYSDAEVSAAADIVARYVADWYRHAMPEESARIVADIAGWRRTLS